jgi:cytochrome P450
MTALLAGHETTATGLTWTWYLLSKYPEVRARVQAEVNAVLSGRDLTVADVAKLEYTHMVLQEVMRLYPPVWVVGRSVTDDDELGGYHVPAGSHLLASPYVTHRHPDIWENPEGFDPERFRAASAERARFAYFPFGGGPRTCAGNHFAMLEAMLVIAMVSQRYNLDVVPGQTIQPHPRITLPPKHGLFVTVRKAQAADGVTVRTA